MTMHSDAMPIIKMEVQYLKHAIMTHLGAAGSELGDRIDAEIQRQIDAFPWNDIIAKCIADAISEQLRGYFKHGKGYRAISAAIEEAFDTPESKA